MSAVAADVLFSYAAHRDQRLIVELDAFGNDADVTVVATVRSTRADRTDTQRYTFPTGERAHTFVAETLTALEYLGCDISGGHA